MIFFLFFPENSIWHFMQIVSCFLGKIRKIFQYVVCWKFYPELILSTSHMVPSFLYDCAKSALSSTPLPWNPSWSTAQHMFFFENNYPSCQELSTENMLGKWTNKKYHYRVSLKHIQNIFTDWILDFSTSIYSQISIAGTPMTCEPWLIQTRFWFPRKFFR